MFFESFMLNITVIVVLVGALTFDYATKFFSYWYVRHIPNNTPIPFFGTDYFRVLGFRSNTEEVNTLYNQHPKEKFTGRIKSRIPDLIVKDPDAVKTILSTDFANFHRRGLGLDKSRDVCIRNNLFYAEGENWTLLRDGLESILGGLTNEFEDSFRHCLSGTNGDTNVQQLLSKVLDVVFKDLLLEQGSDGAVITQMRTAAQKRTIVEMFKTYLKNVFPSLFIMFGLATLPGEPSSMTKKVLEKSKLIDRIKQANVFQLGLKDKNRKSSDVDFAFAVLATFVTEGYVPCLNSITSLLHDLAMNPHIQKKARSSADYLNASIKESLRLHPSFSAISRQCVKMYNYSDGKFVIDKNVTVTVPIEAIHRDEKYHTDARTYYPERHMPDKDSSSHSFAYLPFGVGPRKCIGEQLSMGIIQNVTSTILKDFELEPCQQTPQEINLVDHNFGRIVSKDIWLRFKPIRS